jgi:hypothetical protein
VAGGAPHRRPAAHRDHRRLLPVAAAALALLRANSPWPTAYADLSFVAVSGAGGGAGLTG